VTHLSSRQRTGRSRCGRWRWGLRRRHRCLRRSDRCVRREGRRLGWRNRRIGLRLSWRVDRCVRRRWRGSIQDTNRRAAATAIAALGSAVCGTAIACKDATVVALLTRLQDPCHTSPSTVTSAVAVPTLPATSRKRKRDRRGTERKKCRVVDVGTGHLGCEPGRRRVLVVAAVPLRGTRPGLATPYRARQPPSPRQ
jgi:hypothetical protein